MTEKWAITLHTVIEGTGEMEHLYQLVDEQRSRMPSDILANPEERAMLMLESVINPVLNALEEYLRSALRPEMTPEEVKAIVHEWIEEQRAQG